MKVYKQSKAGRTLYTEQVNEELKIDIIEPTVADEIKLKDIVFSSIGNDPENKAEGGKTYSSILLFVSMYCLFNGEKYGVEKIAETFDDEFIVYLTQKINAVKLEAEKKSLKG